MNIQILNKEPILNSNLWPSKIFPQVKYNIKRYAGSVTKTSKTPCGHVGPVLIQSGLNTA